MAGGRGSRLKDLTQYRAKPAVHFGGKYRVIDFTLSNCINSGIRRIGVLTQYEGHELIRHLQHGWGFLRGQFGEFIELLPAEQKTNHDLWYAGTADAVYQNRSFITTHRPRHVVILAGDHIYKMDYGAMLADHVHNEASITIGCVEVPIAEAVDFGVISMDRSRRITGFAEKSDRPKPMPKKPDRALVSMGIYIFDTSCLLDLLSDDASLEASKHDFGRDVIPAALGNLRMFGYPLPDIDDHSRQGYWRDVGTIESYWKANIELADVVPELNLYDERWPIWTRQEQVPPAKFVFGDATECGCAIDSLVSGGCIVAGASVTRSVLFTHAHASKGSVIDSSLLLPGAVIGEHCRVSRAVIDAGCRIPDGTVIGENAEEDGRRYLRSGGGIVLVTRDMLDDRRA